MLQPHCNVSTLAYNLLGNDRLTEARPPYLSTKLDLLDPSSPKTNLAFDAAAATILKAVATEVAAVT